MAFQTIDLTPILDSKRVEQFLIGLDVDTVVDKVLRGVSLEEVVFFDYPPSISLNPTYYEKIRDSIPLKQMNFPKKNLHKKSITGCMITLNEKDFISRALDSVIPLVDEMVIVDGGSVDGTLDIISKYPKVKLIQNKMPEDFSQQRNIYLRHVTSDWILVIDSDEAFEPNFKDALHTLISIGRFTSFWFPRKNFCPNDSEYIVNSGPGYQKRLFQNQPGIHYEGRVHEDIVGLKGDHGFVLDISILHYGFLKPIEFRAEKLKKWDEWSGYNDSAILNRKFETKRYEGVKVKRTLRVVNYQQWKKMKEK
jgi:glycosyltransferase involved in cell wall biosynthesis